MTAVDLILAALSACTPGGSQGGDRIRQGADILRLSRTCLGARGDVP